MKNSNNYYYSIYDDEYYFNKILRTTLKILFIIFLTVLILATATGYYFYKKYTDNTEKKVQGIYNTSFFKKFKKGIATIQYGTVLIDKKHCRELKLKKCVLKGFWINKIVNPSFPKASSKYWLYIKKLKNGEYMEIIPFKVSSDLAKSDIKNDKFSSNMSYSIQIELDKNKNWKMLWRNSDLNDWLTQKFGFNYVLNNINFFHYFNKNNIDINKNLKNKILNEKGK